MLMKASPFSLEVADYLFAQVGSLEAAILTWWRLLWKYRRDLIKRGMEELALHQGG